MIKQAFLAKILLNFATIGLLLALLSSPFYFATNFAKVAGVKSTAPFLIVPQIDRFPNLKFSQNQDIYEISFTKLGPQQAYLGVLIINNPTPSAQTYRLQVLAGDALVFFGQDPDNLISQLVVPSTASVPISLYSPNETIASSQTVEFTIQVQ